MGEIEGVGKQEVRKSEYNALSKNVHRIPVYNLGFPNTAYYPTCSHY